MNLYMDYNSYMLRIMIGFILLLYNIGNAKGLFTLVQNFYKSTARHFIFYFYIIELSELSYLCVSVQSVDEFTS